MINRESQHPRSRRNRLAVGLGVTASAIAAALAGSASAYADEPPCSSDICSVISTLGPFETIQDDAPATDYTSDGFFLNGPQGVSDGFGFDIASGQTSLVPEFPGIAGETVLYTDYGGVVGSPIELLPFDIPL
jgi:hypothetical protein